MKQSYNPFLPSWEYIPDGEPYVFGERLYLYGSHDRFGGDQFCMNDYVCWSAPVEDLSQWHYEGVIYRKDQDPCNPEGTLRLYAPDVQKGLDGRYYLYYAFDDTGIISVAVCDTPAGAYSYHGTVQYPDGSVIGENKGDIHQFDPGVFIDDDERIYLYSGFGIGDGAESYFGGRKANGMYCMELARDMFTVISGPTLLLKGNMFEGKKNHGFFEASSMRKIDGVYYFIYSSSLSHELCYMTSDRPDGGFIFGGTIVSNGDVGYLGRKHEHRLNHTGNTHGSLVQVKGKWYVFYHRQTNRHHFSRQACAEAITINPDGTIPQVEITSCGLNGTPLPGEDTYPAYIACNLFTHDHSGYDEENYENDKRPYLTQDGGDREGGENQYITGWKNGGVVGFKYFHLDGISKASIAIKGTGKGHIELRVNIDKPPIASIPINATNDYCTFTEGFPPLKGTAPLYFQYNGTGAICFKEFSLSK